jgi:hypothetical protein
MVRLRTTFVAVTISLIALTVPRIAFALMTQTQRDLAVLEDNLKFHLETESGLRTRLLPMLVASPKHLWVESRDDFSPASIDVLKRVFREPDALVLCTDCDTYRLHVRDNNTLAVINGELSLADLARLRQDPRFKGAKSLATISETAAGVEMRVTSLDDGAILYFALADSTQTLDDARPYMHLSQELERRKFGESLAYIFVNLGLYPDPQVQFEYLEQWGRYNQHISGIALSLLSPNVAVGPIYHYLLPSMRKLNISGAILFPLQNLFRDDSETQDVTNTIVAQFAVAYAFSSTFGMYVGATSEANFTIGFNLFNPLLVPFML